jgi:dihydrofolate reductase
MSCAVGQACLHSSKIRYLFHGIDYLRHRRRALAKLIYTAITSLDGYVADEFDKFDWAVPSEAVHNYINELERPIGSYLYGRRLYEVMVGWETVHAESDQPPYIRDYATIWQTAEKTVYSKSMERVSSSRTRIERDFDPDKIRMMKETSVRNLSIGGPNIAAQAIKAGLVDEYHFFVTPILVGGGKQCLPEKVRLKLELLDECRFDNGMVHIHYATVK